jgi:YfiH family protein
MIRTTQNGVSYYQFRNLAAFSGVEHRIFARRGGHSQRPFASLNVCYGIGDTRKNVSANRGVISHIMATGRLVFVRQVHGCEIAVLGRNRKKHDKATAGRAVTADALVTNLDKKNLVIQVADCQAVLLYEPTRRVIANVHCGWRGSVQNIIGRTIRVMEQHFGCHPSRIQAGIGPSLGPCCAEFINYRKEIPMEFWRYKGLNAHFDFWSLSRDQMIQAGMVEINIESSGICTRCHTDDFFSYRAAKTTGRFAAVIGLTEKKS